MKITVNGKELQFQGSTIDDIIRHYGLDIDSLVVEKNGHIVHREDAGTAVVNEGDIIELVRFVGGG